MRKFAPVLNRHELNRWTYRRANVSFRSILLIHGCKPESDLNGHVIQKTMIKRAFSFWSKENKPNITNEGTNHLMLTCSIVAIL